MTTAYFIDVHVLGEPDEVRMGMKAIRAFLIKEEGQEEGSVVGKPSPVKSAVAPWPVTGAHQMVGVVFDGGSLAPPSARFKQIAAEGLAATPAITVALVHWDLDDMGVKILVSTHVAGKVETVRAAEADESRLEKALGQEWSEALNDDGMLDNIGDLLLPTLLAKPKVKAALAPLEARAKHTQIDAALPKVSSSAKPRF